MALKDLKNEKTIKNKEINFYPFGKVPSRASKFSNKKLETKFKISGDRTSVLVPKYVDDKGGAKYTDIQAELNLFYKSSLASQIEAYEQGRPIGSLGESESKMVYGDNTGIANKDDLTLQMELQQLADSYVKKYNIKDAARKRPKQIFEEVQQIKLTQDKIVEKKAQQLKDKWRVKPDNSKLNSKDKSKKNDDKKEKK